MFQKLVGKGAQAKWALAAFAIVLAPFSGATAAVYNLDWDVGVGSIVGTIETDGTIGTLQDGNILGFSIVAEDGVNTVTITPSNSFFANNVGTALSATADHLLFNFDAPGLQYWTAQGGPDNSTNLCFQSASGACNGSGSGIGLRIFASGQDQHRPLSGTVAIASTAPVPLPAALPLLGLALAGLGAAGLRRRS